MKILKIIPNIINPIRTSLKKRAIKGYEKEMTEITNDFLGIKPVAHNNLKKAYDKLIKQYSLQLAIKKINLLNLLRLKLMKIKTEELAHIARLPRNEQKIFIKNQKKYGTIVMLKMAIFKNNSTKFMQIALKDYNNRKTAQKAGINIEKFQKAIISHKKKDLNLDIIQKPIEGILSETIETTGMKLIKRITENANKTPEKISPKLRDCFSPKVFQKNYIFPTFHPTYNAWYNARGKAVLPIDKYYDAIPRDKIISLAEKQITKK